MNMAMRNGVKASLSIVCVCVLGRERVRGLVSLLSMHRPKAGSMLLPRRNEDPPSTS